MHIAKQAVGPVTRPALRIGWQQRPARPAHNVFKGYDITCTANEHGQPVLLFCGQRRPDGLLVSERFTRTSMRQPGTLEVKASH
jgi:hypothetical protein